MKLVRAAESIEMVRMLWRIADMAMNSTAMAFMMKRVADVYLQEASKLDAVRIERE